MNGTDAAADIQECRIRGDGWFEVGQKKACLLRRAATPIAPQLALGETAVEFSLDTCALGAAGHLTGGQVDG